MASSILCLQLCCFVLSALTRHILSQTPVAAKNGQFSVQIIHRNSPNSPFYKPDEHYADRFRSFYHRPNNSFRPNIPFSRVTSNNGDYLMKLSFGTPPVDLYGLADTGSDLVWAQCTPCNRCYRQKNPKFDPRKSSTYSAIPCHSDQCHLLYVGASCSSQKHCHYSYGYADSSMSTGVLAKETFRFSSTTGEPVVVGDLVFGCGHNNSGTFNENDMGIIGLGGGPLSLVSQIGTLYGSKRFSQCLVPFHTDPGISGALNFGEGSEVSGEGVVTTPLVYKEGQTPYLVTLEGISVGDTFVPFNSSKKLSKGNIMIDSGTPATYLPQDFYDRLVEELKGKSSMVPIEDDPHLGSQLCYRTTEASKIEGPIFTAHFEGADVQLMAFQIFIQPKHGVHCFAMAGASDGEYIYGSFAQSNYLIGFDLDRKTVSFKSTDCANQ